MKSFKLFIEDISSVLLEEIHKEIQDIMDSDIPPRQRLSAISSKIREIHARGDDSGLETTQGDPAKPAGKGSSRAIFLPREHDKIILDGKEVHIPTAVKVAYHGQLDKYHNESLLGEDQNLVEADGYNKHHSLFKHLGGNEYETNEDGILAPVLDHHEDGQWLKMVRADKMKAADFKKHTKQYGYPFSLKELSDVMHTEHGHALGRVFVKLYNHDKILENEYAQNFHEYSGNMGLAPGDIMSRNFGMITHPITGKKYPVMIDYGATIPLIQRYIQLRLKQFGRR